MFRIGQSNTLPRAIDIKRELQRITANKHIALAEQHQSFFGEVKKGDAPRSDFFDPFHVGEVSIRYATQPPDLRLLPVDRWLSAAVGGVSKPPLRQVSKKAWLINLCITSVIRKVRQYLKPSTNRNLCGFVVHKIGDDLSTVAGKKSKEREAIEAFLTNTGTEKDSDRDNFMCFCDKIIRDLIELDQVATEVCYTLAGKPYAFMAVDAATIEKVLPNQNNPDKIKFVQVIDGMPRAYYPEGTLIFDYQNPRTDIRFSPYGFSYVAQAIDLVTGSINAFTYNAGFFTENKLPKGLLLLDGNANQETIEQMEGYICDIMSGSAANQWHIPIIPGGYGNGGESGGSIKWVSLAGTNREMEFQAWLDFLASGIVSLFGCSMEELGLHSSKSQPLIDHNDAPKIEASKSAILADILSFLQQYINRILEIAFPGWELEFVGYEKDDPKQMLDLAKGELESYKTLNEVRKDKGLPPLEGDWANACPANAQLIQMYQAAQQQEQGGDEGGTDEGEGDMGGMEGDDEEDDGNVDDDAWGDIDGKAQSKDNSGNDDNNNGGKEVHKSLNVW